MMKVRKFEPSDLEAVMKIAKVSFPKNRTLAKSFKKYYQTYPDGFVVSEEMGEILGFIVGQFENEIGEITSLAVRPVFRQKGVGTELVRYLSGHFKVAGFKEIFLHVRTDNNLAVSFFQNLDFRVLKTIKKYYKNKDDAFLMGKSI